MKMFNLLCSKFHSKTNNARCPLLNHSDWKCFNLISTVLTATKHPIDGTITPPISLILPCLTGQQPASNAAFSPITFQHYGHGQCRLLSLSLSLSHTHIHTHAPRTALCSLSLSLSQRHTRYMQNKGSSLHL